MRLQSLYFSLFSLLQLGQMSMILLEKLMTKIYQRLHFISLYGNYNIKEVCLRQLTLIDRLVFVKTALCLFVNDAHICSKNKKQKPIFRDKYTILIFIVKHFRKHTYDSKGIY